MLRPTAPDTHTAAGLPPPTPAADRLHPASETPTPVRRTPPTRPLAPTASHPRTPPGSPPPAPRRPHQRAPVPPPALLNVTARPGTRSYPVRVGTQIARAPGHASHPTARTSCQRTVGANLADLLRRRRLGFRSDTADACSIVRLRTAPSRAHQSLVWRIPIVCMPRGGPISCWSWHE